MPTILSHIYKSTCFVLLILLVHTNLNGQNVLYTPIELSKTTGSTQELLLDIEQQAHITFSYSSKLCFQEQVILPTPKGTVHQLLDALFVNCQSNYIVRGQKVIIEPIEGVAQKFVISGYVIDSQSKEALIQSNVYEPELLIGTVSNNFGFYSITVPKGFVHVSSSYVGYHSRHHYIELNKDTTINFLMEQNKELGDVDVVGDRVSGRVKGTRPGAIEVPIEQIKNVPVFLGEVDIVKSIQLLPGIQSGGEGFSELYVRGGGPDQNLVLMDDVPIYNVSHLLGFFSIFNADAVNNVRVIKGGFPARYGGRLSSVVDIRMNDGNNDELKGVASIGLLSSRLAIDGPLIKDKSSFSVSFRRTYFDLFTSMWQLNQADKSRYYFYDFNTKLNYRFSRKDRLYLSTYMGKDQYGISYNEQKVVVEDLEDQPDRTFTTYDENDVGWRNYVAALRWNHVFGNKMFANTSILYSDYRFFIDQTLNYVSDNNWSKGSQSYYSGIRDMSAKIDVDYVPSPKHYIRFGGSAIAHVFYPGIDVQLSNLTGVSPIDTTFGGAEMHRSEYRMYLEDDFHLLPRLKMNIGGHFSLFQTESDKFYYSIEPRLSARYLLKDNLSIKAAYSHMTQYMHLLRTASVAMPTDLWLPVSDQIEPMRAVQSALGIEYEINKGFSLSLELYHKKLSNILAYKETAGYFDFASDWQSKLTSGDGESYGIELLLHRKMGNLTGWFGYTFSKSTNQFDELNNGKEFPANYDRTHDVSLYATYKFSEKVDMGATWSFGTGSPLTLPETKYYAPQLPTSELVNSSFYNQYINERNSYRMPNFHRLDVGFNFKKKKSYGSRLWSVGLMNTYGRQNAFFLYFADSENEETGETERSLKQFSLFPIPMPYVRYTVKF
ncbi:TonB-dependent receptor domain-containing protein [Carboxylicivirga sp. M1479]|uniref:TonB-dependent receptor n=1 Tax=Carboxylicivirga sp. M1479 TaxID=2594476 RepID=UPI0011781985|nr:TonB-dependent receptor [Carboxylicivirga sp. M1479]TRX62993.1 TonB-dependent receptor [Carboxylicivirga sp. M1479]